MKRRILAALGLATLGVFAIGALALGQGDTAIDEPTIGMLASVMGLSTVIYIVMTFLRNPIPADVFDRWAPTIAVFVGVGFALLYTVTTTDPITAESVIQAILLGLFAGSQSQNVNTIVKRATGDTT